MALFNTIHHIALISADYPAARHFYVDLLGFDVVRESYRAQRDDWKLDLKAGDIELEIFSGKNNPPRPNYPEALGLRHLAFRVKDVEAAAKELEAKGIEVEPIRSDPIGGGRMTFFKDPDGLPLELHE